MNHVAFDLGLLTSGVAWAGGSDHHTCPAHLRRSPMTEQMQQERYAWWRSTFAMLLFPHRGVDVVIEAPFLHTRHPSGSVALIMLHGVLRGVAVDGGHDVHTVAPTVLKRWATGSGNATKELMVLAAVERGWEPGDECDHNEADA